jgi:hypothetical protein
VRSGAAVLLCIVLSHHYVSVVPDTREGTAVFKRDRGPASPRDPARITAGDSTPLRLYDSTIPNLRPQEAAGGPRDSPRPSTERRRRSRDGPPWSSLARTSHHARTGAATSRPGTGRLARVAWAGWPGDVGRMGRAERTVWAGPPGGQEAISLVFACL